MQIPSSSVVWQDRTKDLLSSCNFDMFVTNMNEVSDEFGGSPRKQTKVETIAAGFKHTHNAVAAKGLLGRRIIISRTGKPLHVTTMPKDVLEKIPLPQEFEDELNGGAGNSSPAGNSAFAGFSGSITPTAGGNKEDKRLGMAAKVMFQSIGASLEVVYPHDDGDLLVCQVVDIAKKPDAVMSMVEAVFDGGEHPEGHNKFHISFGYLKDIK